MVFTQLDISEIYPEKFKTQFACEVKGFDPNDYLDRKEARKMDLFTIFAMVTAQEAFEDSGLNVEKLKALGFKENMPIEKGIKVLCH